MGYPSYTPLALLTGTVLSITAIPATVKVLEEFELLRTRLGQTIVAAALFDDVLGLFLLALLIGVIETGHVPGVLTLALIVGKAILFFVVTTALGAHVYPHVSRRLALIDAAALELSALATVGLAYGLLAEALSLHWILGAFVAGLFGLADGGNPVGAHLFSSRALTAVVTTMLAPLLLRRAVRPESKEGADRVGPN